jgi:hypothetical protein
VPIKEAAKEASKAAEAIPEEVFRANGTVSLVGTRVGRTLHCASGYFLNTEAPKSANSKHHRWRPALDLRNARVAYLSYSHRPNKKEDVHLENGQLLLDGFVYDRISQGTKQWNECLEWIDKQSPKHLSDFAPQPYLQLAKVLREEGDPGGAKSVLYEMEKRRTQYLWRGETKSWCWRILKQFTIGYGYYSWWALLWLAGICLLGAMNFHFGNAYMAPTDRAAYNVTETPPGGPLPGNYVVFNPFLYSVENTLPIIKLGQTDHWEPLPHPLPPLPKTVADVLHWLYVELSPPGILGVLRVFQIAVGWFLTTIGVAGLTGIIRKD